LNTTEFPRATSFTFKFQPTAVTNNSTGVIQLAGFSTYSSEPRGLDYYLASLGVRIVVVDQSIVATSSDPLQSLASYSGLLGEMSNWSVARFGNLTIYAVPGSQPLVSAVDNWSTAPSYFLAWAKHTNPAPYFAVAPPAWLEQTSSISQLNSTEESPGEYSVTVHTTGPFVISLLQTYDSLWQAILGGTVVSAHFVLNGFANGWLINQTGSFTIELVFQPVLTYDTLVVITPVAGVIAFVMMLPVTRRTVISGVLRFTHLSGRFRTPVDRDPN